MRWKQESHRALRPDQSQELCLRSYGMLRWSPVQGPYFLNNLSDQDLTFATYLYLDGCRLNKDRDRRQWWFDQGTETLYQKAF
jgi:hypothetical protein